MTTPAKNSTNDITTDTGKLADALRQSQSGPDAARQAADQLRQMNNPDLAARFQRAAERLTVAFLEPVVVDAKLALQRAYVGFRRREGRPPTFATAGSGVELDPAELARLHLTQTSGQTRPGHILVWSEPEDEQ